MSENCHTYTSIKPAENSPRQLFRHARKALLQFRWCGTALVAFLLACMTAGACRAQGRNVICRDGTGEFEAEFRTGVKVRVGAARNEGLAVRVCEAELSWGDQHLVTTAAAAQLDVDAFGADLGVEMPVVALQVKSSKANCCMTYEIYSLREPPVLVRRISGGQFFSAADTDMDGRLEIWTNDAAAVEGLENLRLRDLDFAPPVVLRFVRGRLLDASSEFQPYYDQKIADERAQLDPSDLAEFKNSDGGLVNSAGIPAVRLVQLRSVKMKVLEIVWAYLYSGREQEAWRSLAEMWPAADIDRIRAALLNARSRGIRSQVEAVSNAIPSGRAPRVEIFDGTLVVTGTSALIPKGVKPKLEITPPIAILMERPPPATALETELAQSETTLELVIDSAGKVRSATVVGSVQGIDEGLIKSTVNWKFIPAFKDDQPVASRILLGVSLKR